MIYDTRAQNFFFRQLLLAEFCCVFFSLIGLSLSMINYEVDLRLKNSKDETIYNKMKTIKT